MQGYTVLWVPGYDHAGIATQAVVEQRLLKSEGKSRHAYGRKVFLDRVWEWKDQYVHRLSFKLMATDRAARYQSRITGQMERLGGSFDWDRVAFTMSDVSLQTRT